MASKSHLVSVGTTATRISTALPEDDTGSGATVYNAGSATVYLGGSDVTTANGYPLAAGQHLAADLRRQDILYGIVATGSQPVRVFEVSV